MKTLRVCSISTEADQDSTQAVSSITTSAAATSCCVAETDRSYFLYVITKDGKGLRLELEHCTWDVLPSVGDIKEDSSNTLFCLKNVVYAIGSRSLYRLQISNKGMNWQHLMKDIPPGLCTSMGDYFYILDNKKGVLYQYIPTSKKVQEIEWAEPETLKSTISMAGIGYNYIYLTSPHGPPTTIGNGNGNSKDPLVTVTQITLDRKQVMIAGYVPLRDPTHQILLCMST